MSTATTHTHGERVRPLRDRTRTRFTVTLPSQSGAALEDARVLLVGWAETIHGFVTGREEAGSVELLQESKPGLTRFAIALPRLSGFNRDVAACSLAILADVLCSSPRRRAMLASLEPGAGDGNRFAIALPSPSGFNRFVAAHSLAILADLLCSSPRRRAMLASLAPGAGDGSRAACQPPGGV